MSFPWRRESTFNTGHRPFTNAEVSSSFNPGICSTRSRCSYLSRHKENGPSLFLHILGQITDLSEAHNTGHAICNAGRFFSFCYSLSAQVAFIRGKRNIVKLPAAYLRLDLIEVDFIDSSGLSALVSGLKALRERDGRMHLSQPQPQARTALRLTLLDRVFSIFPSLEQAVNEGELPET